MLAKSFEECSVGTYDIWQCAVQCENEGQITQIKNGKEVKLEDKRLVKHFTNYVGIGTDARVSYIAQKLNGQGMTMKKILYGVAGFLSFCLQWGSLSKKICIKQRKSIDFQSEK